MDPPPVRAQPGARAGLSYNPGELVTGSTAPLWTALLALLFLLPGSVLVWTKLARRRSSTRPGSDATWRLSRELGLGRGLSALAAALTLATSWLVWSALSGMEIPLFILLSLWGMILHLRERGDPARPPLSLAVLAVAVLARPEGLLLLLLAFARPPPRLRGRERAGRALRWRRPSAPALLAGAALAACALAGSFLFYAGRAVPSCPPPSRPRAASCGSWLPRTSGTSRTCSASSSGRSRG